AIARGRAALCGADPSGLLWAACVRVLQQARRFGIGAPSARVVRAQRERRLGELAEQTGDMPAAMQHYRAALAAHTRVGVRRRLAQLMRHWSQPATGEAPMRDGTADAVGDLAPSRRRSAHGTGLEERTSMAKKMTEKV